MINQWVSQETQTEIPSLLQPGDLDTLTRLVLVNAVYFKGSWATPFDPNRTKPGPFTLSDGTQVSVPMMNRRVNVASAFLMQNAFSVFELPYQGGSLAMDFLLPQGPLSILESSLTPALLDSALASLGAPSQQDIVLPKFSFGNRVRLDSLLGRMGMPDVFDSTTADLSGVDGARDLHVSFVVQQALVEVDEQGAVAVAATGALLTTNFSGYTIDQPFLFLIRDVKNGSILFMGRVEDPRQGS